MGHEHHHHGAGCKHHHGQKDLNGGRLFWAIVVNVVLTGVQIVGGVLSGSMSLIADALHNLSDAGSLVVAYFAQKISGRPANEEMSYGFGRAEIIGALINSLTLLFIGIYLLIESGKKVFSPEPIEGWTVVVIATVALVIDLITAALTYQGSKDSINMRAAFVHNVTDALASVVVIISGLFIVVYKVYWVDFVATLFISTYVLWHSWGLLSSCIKTLMQAAPDDVNRDEVIKELLSLDEVLDVHHVHIWSIHEKKRMFEAHIKVKTQDLRQVENVKKEIKNILENKFSLNHSTLEFEHQTLDCEKKQD